MLNKSQLVRSQFLSQNPGSIPKWSLCFVTGMDKRKNFSQAGSSGPKKAKNDFDDEDDFEAELAMMDDIEMEDRESQEMGKYIIHNYGFFKVRMLIHIYPHKPCRKINMVICNH